MSTNGRLQGKVCVITHGVGGRDRVGDRGAVRARRRPGRGRRPGPSTRSARWHCRPTSGDENAVLRRLHARAWGVLGRVDVLFNNAGISPNDDASVLDTHARSMGASTGRKPAQRVPVLQARHPASARRRRRLGDQHRLVRCDRSVPRPRKSPTPRRRAECSRCRESSASSSPAGVSGSTPCAQAPSTPRCCRSCTRQEAEGPAAASVHRADRTLRPSRRDRQRCAGAARQPGIKLHHGHHVHGRRWHHRRIHHAHLTRSERNGGELVDPVRKSPRTMWTAQWPVCRGEEGQRRASRRPLSV